MTLLQKRHAKTVMLHLLRLRLKIGAWGKKGKLALIGPGNIAKVRCQHQYPALLMQMRASGPSELPSALISNRRLMLNTQT